MTFTPEVVKLNIGGTLFHTTKATLTRFDGFFRTILETDVPVTKDDSGTIFIDRDPTHFRLILNYMRDWNVKLPACEDKIQEISNEAQYYLLTGLVELCSKQSEVPPRNTIFKVLNSDEEQYSAVLNSKKPVLLISANCNVNDFVNLGGYSKWKQFIEKHSPKWNIFFKKKNSISWCINPIVIKPKLSSTVKKRCYIRKCETFSQIPDCRRCRLHGEVNSHKEYKRFCPYRECPCAKCRAIGNYEQAIASQIKNRIRLNRKRFFFQCSIKKNQYSCGHPCPNESLEYFLIHLEYHMNRYLTHPGAMHFSFQQYLDFLKQNG